MMKNNAILGIILILIVQTCLISHTMGQGWFWRRRRSNRRSTPTTSITPTRTTIRIESPCELEREYEHQVEVKIECEKDSTGTNTVDDISTNGIDNLCMEQHEILVTNLCCVQWKTTMRPEEFVCNFDFVESLTERLNSCRLGCSRNSVIPPAVGDLCRVHANLTSTWIVYDCQSVSVTGHSSTAQSGVITSNYRPTQPTTPAPTSSPQQTTSATTSPQQATSVTTSPQETTSVSASPQQTTSDTPSTVLQPTDHDMGTTLASSNEDKERQPDTNTVTIPVAVSFTVIALVAVVVLMIVCLRRRKAKNDPANDPSGVSTDPQSALPLPVTPTTENIYVSTNAACHYSTLGDPGIVTSHNVNKQYSLVGDPDRVEADKRAANYSLAGDPDKERTDKPGARYSLAGNPDNIDPELNVQEHVTIMVDNDNYAPGPTLLGSKSEAKVDADPDDVDTEIWDNPDYEGPQKMRPGEKPTTDKNDLDDVDTELCDNPDYESSSQVYPESQHGTSFQNKIGSNLDAGPNNDPDEMDVDTEIWDNPDYEGPR